MDGQFAQQLANLQRAASRAGRDDNRSDPVGGRGRGASSSTGGSEARASRGGEYRNRDGNGGRGSSSSSYHDSRDDRYRSHHRDNHRRPDNGRDYSPRKRSRNDNAENNHDDDRYRSSRDYQHGRGSSFAGRGRFGGRWNSQNGDHNRSRGIEHSADNVPLAELVNQVAEKSKLKPDNEATTSNTATTKKRRHIALLFLTIGDLPHEHIWKEWLKSASNNYLMGNKDGEASMTKPDSDCSSSDNDDVLVSVICHAKYPERIQSPWLRQRHLLRRRINEGNVKTESSHDAKFHSRRPEWGSIEITRAMIDLLEEGLRIGSAGGIDGEKDKQYRRYLSTPRGASSENDAADGAIADANPSSIQSETDIPPVDRFVFVSESCLPVATLKELELALFGPRNTVSNATLADKPQNANDCNGNDEQTKPPTKNVESLYNKSWINARSTPNNGYARQLQWDAIRQTDIPHNLVWKADQWLVLTRTHGEAIASMPNKYLEGRQLWPTLRKCRASDEMFFPTALAILGILHRMPGMSEVDDTTPKKESCAGDGIRRRRITYCDWSMGAKNPASFTCVEWKDVVAKARGEGCLFARKFVLASSIRGERKKERGGGSSVVDSNGGLVRVEDWISAVAKGGS